MSDIDIAGVKYWQRVPINDYSRMPYISFIASIIY